MLSMTDWFTEAELSDECTFNTKCKDCKPNGDCEPCGTIDGRWMEAVNEYASTCDNCGDLSMHNSMLMDERTQLGICKVCISKGITLDIFTDLPDHT